MQIIRPYKTFPLLLFVLFCFNCKKDWGTTEKGIYNPIDPPPASARFDPELFDINCQVTPSPVKIGTEAVISVKVARKNNQPIGGNLYYYWKTTDAGFYRFYYSGYYFYYSLESLFYPRLDDNKESKGFNKNPVVFTTNPFEPLIQSFSRDRLLEIIDVFNPVTIKLKIGYENENEEIRYFYSTTVEIILQL